MPLIGNEGMAMVPVAGIEVGPLGEGVSLLEAIWLQQIPPPHST
jgi:hypothetical protein